MPAPRSRPDESSSTRPSSRLAPEDERSSAKTSANSPPSTERLGQHTFEHGGIDHRGLLASRRPLAGFSLRHVWYRRASADRSLRPHRADRSPRPTPPRRSGRERCQCSPRPRLVALCEEASCEAIEGHLAENCTSVAKRLQFDHLVPVGIGGTVWAEATLDRIEGRRLVFTLSVSESAGLVAAGKLVRVVVDRATFLSNVR